MLADPTPFKVLCSITGTRSCHVVIAGKPFWYNLKAPLCLHPCHSLPPFPSLLPFPPSPVIDHGIAQIEIMMEEALQDIPPLVHDIQERLKGISESVAVDGKPRSGLPSRRLLWDRLKPQASAVSGVHVISGL